MRAHHSHEHHEMRFRSSYAAGLIATIGLVLMIVAGINAGVNPNFYWPWAQCHNHKATHHATAHAGTEPASQAEVGQCYANGNDQGVYITTLLFVGLGMFVLFGMLAGILYYSGGVVGRSVGGSLGLATYETGESLKTAADGAMLRPFKVVGDSLKMGVGAPLKTTGYVVKGGKMKNRGHKKKGELLDW